MVKVKKVIVNINIEVPVPNSAYAGVPTDAQAEEYAQNYELPHGYLCDSFEIVKVVEEEEQEFKCRACGTKYPDSFCSAKDVGTCRWCSGEEK